MSIKPLHDRVLLERYEPTEQKSTGGIIIPDTAKEKPVEGTVVAVGDGARTDDGKVTPLVVKVGDRVLYGKYSGTDIKIDGKEYLIVRESEILAIVTK
ncbi:co-chaperone GroES [bacterium]|nr:co-chaperone GroES [bacterium]